MDKHNVSRFVGAPPGYIGYEEGGQLTEKIRRRPYSVVLLDEIEKAHPDVWNMLLQIMEEGRLTDNVGRVIDFKNTILIMTTNIGAQEIIGKQDLNMFRKKDAETTYERTKVSKRLVEKGLTLVMTDEAKEFIIKKGTNKEYGARPLRRAIEHNLEDP